MLKSMSGSSLALSYRWLIWLTCILGMQWFPPSPSQAQNQLVRVIAFGAHPDDCDLGAGGLAAKYAALGNKVKFVSLTNGDAGHQNAAW